MALQRLSLFCLCFLSAVVGLRAQAECDMIQASDIGSTTPSQDGFIAVLLGGVDAAGRPMVSVSNIEVISLAVGSERNMFRWASVFATYDCSGMLCPDDDYPRTEQFEVECVLLAGQSDPIWTDSSFLLEQRNAPVNPSLTSADLRRDCSFCVSPADKDNLGVPDGITIDDEFHCAACAASCLTGGDGLGYCTSPEAVACCNVYQPNAIGVNICAVSCDMGYEADSPDFICERRCPVLSNPTNGQVSHPTRTVGSMATYTCDGLFEVASGDAMRTCQSNSTWDGTAAVCSDCPRLDDPENGMVTWNGLSVGNTASYTCNSGYFVQGTESRTCQAAGWNSSAPTCDACDTKYDDCKECTPDACTECNDGFELDADTGECNSDGTLDTSSGGKGCDGACVGGIIGGLLGAALLAAIVSAIIYGLYKYHTNPATQLKKSDTEGLNGVARDNPLYVDPAIVEAEVAGP